jgi:hypothetical protein
MAAPRFDSKESEERLLSRDLVTPCGRETLGTARRVAAWAKFWAAWAKFWAPWVSSTATSATSWEMKDTVDDADVIAADGTRESKRLGWLAARVHETASPARWIAFPLV